MPATRKGQVNQEQSVSEARILTGAEEQEMIERGLLEPAPQRQGRPLDERLDAKDAPTSNICCWAAGLFEGKGSAGARGTSRKCIAIHVNEETIRRLRRYFGGSIAWENGYSVWLVNAGRAEAFFEKVARFLSAERRAYIRTRLGLEGENPAKIERR